MICIFVEIKKVIRYDYVLQKKIGEYGESLAVEYLKRKKYRIIARNVKFGCKEIDIIAKVNEKTILLEVKTRISEKMELAEDNFNRIKINNLKEALEIYAVNTDANPDDIRLDLITIDIIRSKKTANIKHYKDVF